MFAHSRINQRKGFHYNRSTKIIKVSGSSRGEFLGDECSADRVGFVELIRGERLARSGTKEMMHPAE